MIRMLGTILQFVHQIWEREAIDFRDLFKRAKLPHKTAGALGLCRHEDRKGAGPFLQYFFNRQPNMKKLCVHYL